MVARCWVYLMQLRMNKTLISASNFDIESKLFTRSKSINFNYVDVFFAI